MWGRKNNLELILAGDEGLFVTADLTKFPSKGNILNTFRHSNNTLRINFSRSYREFVRHF